MNTDAVTRFEVIDHRVDGLGRLFVAWPCVVELSVQDNGRTLKVFVTDNKADQVDAVAERRFTQPINPDPATAMAAYIRDIRATDSE